MAGAVQGLFVPQQHVDDGDELSQMLGEHGVQLWESRSGHPGGVVRGMPASDSSGQGAAARFPAGMLLLKLEVRAVQRWVCFSEQRPRHCVLFLKSHAVVAQTVSEPVAAAFLQAAVTALGPPRARWGPRASPRFWRAC